jgi:hypothetical protein
MFIDNQLNSRLSIGNLATPGVLTNVANIDNFSHFQVIQSTVGVAATLPTPTNTNADTIAKVTVFGAGSLIMYGVTITNNTFATFLYNGGAWNPQVVATPINDIAKVSTTLAISAMTINTVPLFTVPAGKTLNITNIVLKVSSATGTTTVTPAISLGTNGGTYNNILSNTTLIGTTATGRLWNQPIIGSSIDIQSGIGIFLRVNTAQAGATALTYTAELFGNLI